jgi:hypothetical protein
MVPDNLITYIIIAIAAALAYLIYRNRKRIQQSVDDDMDAIKDLNATDPEIDMYMHKHRGSNSADLIETMNNGGIPYKEQLAIRKILIERQGTMPPHNP